MKSETDEEAMSRTGSLQGWKFDDNSHLKKPVLKNQTQVQEVLLFRNLRAKGHREGLTPEEFEWYNKRNSDKDFMKLVKKFKKHSHGTIVAGIALREGDNINVFPIRGLHIPSPVVAVQSEDGTETPLKAKTPQEKFNEEINNSLDRVTKKFNKICYYLSQRKINVVNASYGITYKNIVTRFRDTYKKHAGIEIDEPRLQNFVNLYFMELYRRGEKTIRSYPNILFVFSAGNSGLDNDKFHHWPSKIKLPNTITVAAANGDYLAGFSNYGKRYVDIAAPGVGIVSIVPKVYGKELYSPASGTSMAAPYISNLAAQIMNANARLSAPDVKKIILETGSMKSHLTPKLVSGAIVDNNRAIKAALLSKDMSVDQAITLSGLDIIPIEDKINFSVAPPMKILENLPKAIGTDEVDDGPILDEATKPKSSKPANPTKGPPGKSETPVSAPQATPAESYDQDPSNSQLEQSRPPSEETPASSSPPQSTLPSDPPADPLPGSPPS